MSYDYSRTFSISVLRQLDPYTFHRAGGPIYFPHTFHLVASAHTNYYYHRLINYLCVENLFLYLIHGPHEQ